MEIKNLVEMKLCESANAFLAYERNQVCCIEPCGFFNLVYRFKLAAHEFRMNTANGKL